ncbi:MAG: succinate dehydrogenase, hydrophobic membrane anchor protein [Alphaproteobacteria bacterium]|nr:succinate dehydrogenase, hydrophobic membrane anchor protein [Alphaproteobacteria bacterium]
MSLRSPLARVRGLGSAKEGVQHWWMQRLTAVALVPLSLWFVAAIVCHAGAGHAQMRAWIAAPTVAIPMLLLIVATFHHAQLGLQVVIEDYVHHEGVKVASLIAVKFLAVVLAAISVFAVLKLAFGG